MKPHGTCIGHHKPKCNNKILKRTEFSTNFEEDAYVDPKPIFSMASDARTLQILDYYTWTFDTLGTFDDTQHIIQSNYDAITIIHLLISLLHEKF